MNGNRFRIKIELRNKNLSIYLNDRTNSNLEYNFWSIYILKSLDILKDSSINDKKELIQFLVNSYKKNRVSLDKIKLLFEEYKKALKQNGFNIMEVLMSLDYKGLSGIKSTFGMLSFEVGINFDPYLNIFFIPASTIKGAIRSALIRSLILFNNYNEKEAERKANELFGDDESISKVNFMDAYPIDFKEFLVVPDITNPHYTEIETEFDVKPIPIVHLALSDSVTFMTLVYWKDLSSEEVEMLKNAIFYGAKLGIGAKTSIGYSTFTVKKITEINRI